MTSNREYREIAMLLIIIRSRPRPILLVSPNTSLQSTDAATSEILLAAY